MKNKIIETVYTRTHKVGRIPSLRDKILGYLEGQESPKTAREIAEAIGVHKSTPYRPLKELVKLKLLASFFGLDGEEFVLDREYLEYFKAQPRRTKNGS